MSEEIKDETVSEAEKKCVVEGYNLKIAIAKMRARGLMLEKLEKDGVVPNDIAFDIIDVTIMVDFINDVAVALGLDPKRVVELHGLLLQMQIEAAQQNASEAYEEGEEEEETPQPDNEFIDPSVH
jgi:hypothetical protein